MKITEITLNPQMVIPGDPLRFRVGEPVTEGGHGVEKIAYNPITRLFNKGLEIGQGSYAVYFTDIAERRLIVESMVTSVEAVKENKAVAPAPASSEAAVELPS